MASYYITGLLHFKKGKFITLLASYYITGFCNVLVPPCCDSPPSRRPAPPWSGLVGSCTGWRPCVDSTWRRREIVLSSGWTAALARRLCFASGDVNEAETHCESGGPSFGVVGGSGPLCRRWGRQRVQDERLRFRRAAFSPWGVISGWRAVEGERVPERGIAVE